MSILANKAMKEMRKKSINITKGMIEQEQSKKTEKKANKNTSQVVQNTMALRIIQAGFWLMLAYLSFRTLL